MPSLINSDDGVVSGSAGLKTTGSNDGILALQNNGTTNVTVTAAGNVGIGTSSPSTKLQVSGANSSSIGVINGATRGVRFGADTVGAIIEGVDNTGVISYQPLFVGGLDVRFTTSNIERARITAAGDFQFNSGYGSVATAYGCRAWVNFNGTGTVAIRASGNVSSITDGGVGLYTVNFTNAMPDANYAVDALGSAENTGFGSMTITHGYTLTTSAVQLRPIGNSTYYDPLYVNVAIFR
jgi:hypothetical protein